MPTCPLMPSTVFGGPKSHLDFGQIEQRASKMRGQSTAREAEGSWILALCSMLLCHHPWYPETLRRVLLLFLVVVVVFFFCW